MQTQTKVVFSLIRELVSECNAMMWTDDYVLDP